MLTRPQPGCRNQSRTDSDEDSRFNPRRNRQPNSAAGLPDQWGHAGTIGASFIAVKGKGVAC